MKPAAFLSSTFCITNANRGCLSRGRGATCPRMVLPADETAVDMLTFALSGPAWVAGGVLLASMASVVYAFGEVGPRRRPRVLYLLRLDAPEERRVELADGSVRKLRAGENVLQLMSREECGAIAKAVGGNYLIYRAEGSEMKLIGQGPSSVGDWPALVDNSLQARWEEYQHVGEDDRVEKEWKKVVDRLGGIQTERNDCRLCGGTGMIRCAKCGGVGSQGTFVCTCERGRQKCTWCYS